MMGSEKAIEILGEMREGLKITLQDKYADAEERAWANETDTAYCEAIQALKRVYGGMQR